MLGSIDAVAESKGENPIAESPRLHIPIFSSDPVAQVRELYYEMLKDRTDDTAPALLRKARAEILSKRIFIPLNPVVYAAYAYLLLHFPNVPAEDRAKYINEIIFTQMK